MLSEVFTDLEKAFLFFWGGERKYSIYLQGVKQENVQQIFKGPELGLENTGMITLHIS